MNEFNSYFDHIIIEIINNTSINQEKEMFKSKIFLFNIKIFISRIVNKLSKDKKDSTIIQINFINNIISQQIDTLWKILIKYERLFSNKLDFINESKKNWIYIILLSNIEWEFKSVYQYHLSSKEWKIVDIIFDK